jgi:thiol-disulfide isomerase/thioredoxin
MMKRFAVVLICSTFAMPANASTFTLTDTQGRTHTLEQYRGKWVLLNLWATWCAPCLAEMPELEALSQSRHDLIVLGLAVDGQNERRVSLFADKLDITYPIIAGNEKLARPFKPKGFPTTILFNASGEQVMFKEGPVTQSDIEQVLDRKGMAR